MGVYKDRTEMIGQRYGRWTVLEVGLDYYEPSGRKNQGALCHCDCGNERVVPIHSLLSLKTPSRSCGCLQKEKIQQQGFNNKKQNTYDLTGEYGIGYCSNTGHPFYFDLEDYDKIKNYCIYEHHPSKQNYARPVYNTGVREGKGKSHIYPLWYALGFKGYDHINNNTFDNRKSNLRKCTQQQNVFNSKLARNNSSGITGISWIESLHRWRARIMLNRQEIHLGVFKDFEEAVKVRLLAEKKYFGEFAPQKHLYAEYGIEED